MGHFTRLSEHDRQLRFRNYCTNEAIKKYLQSIDFVKDRILGISGEDSVLVAVAHITFYATHKVAEISLSVNSEYRRFGYGQALLNQAKQIAHDCSVSHLKISCLTSNRPMISLALKNGFCPEACEDDEWEGALLMA